MTIQTLKSVKVYSSDTARSHWRDILDVATGGGDVVVERYGKPIAAIIPYADYEALLEALEDLRDARDAQIAYEEWQRDPSLGRPYDEIRAEWVTQGRLDE